LHDSQPQELSPSLAGLAKVVASAPTESMPAPTPVPVRKTVPPGMAVTVPPRELPTVPEVAADVEVEVRSDRKKLSSGCKTPFPMMLVGGF